jgi:hypothetical protein
MASDPLTFNDVLEEERAEIQRRRGPSEPDRPLVGLAISGGGIRSATFGLGVLESLKSIGVLKRVDYLSTVSGGGFIGSWLSANCKRHEGWLEPDANWTASIAHLRRYSNYLSPRLGFFSADTWSMLTIWFRNALLTQAIVILVVACALLLPRPLFELFQHWPQAGGLRWITILLFVLGIVGIAGNQMRLTSERDVPLLHARNWSVGLLLGVLFGGGAWAYGAWVDFDPFHGGPVRYAHSAPIAMALVLAGFALQPVGVRVTNAVWPGPNPPEQINYTQGWVQAVVVVPLMISAYLVAAILWGEAIGAPGVQGLNSFNTYGELVRQAWRYWPFPLSVVFVSFWLLSFCSIHSRKSKLGLFTAAWAPLVSVPVLHALLCGVMLLLRTWSEDPAVGAWKAFVWAPPLVAGAFVIAIVVLIGMMGRESTEEVREWWSRLAAWLGIYATAWMVIMVSAVYGPLFVQWAIDNHPWKSVTISGGWVGTVLGGLLAGGSGKTDGLGAKSTMAKAREALAIVAPFLFVAGLLLGVAYVLDVLIRQNGATWSSVGAGLHAAHDAFIRTSTVALAGCAAALGLLSVRVDINQFSLNAFYRNRLVRCYLGATRFRPGERQPQNFTGFDERDDLPLADLAGDADSRGPFHIITCALNLGGSSDLALHTRHSASFTLSALHCGSAYASREQTGESREIGYVPTRTFGGPANAPTLGQAVSVSGAAASPNMGYHTSPLTAFLLTLFNVRLGWWFPNPSRRMTDASSPIFSLRYLFAELFGDANDKSRFLMISDGGHFENLAAYELIKRQCDLVIISDAECDPDLTFAGLGTLIRMCAVDFGTAIEIDVREIASRSPEGWSARRWAEGTIDYGPGRPKGRLIYLKASMTGGEDTPVLQYKKLHPTFPHETTGDQFYGEDQFESYRVLGREVALEAFRTLQDKGELRAVADEVRAAVVQDDSVSRT